MNLPLPLIIACVIIILALIIFPLIISYKAEKKENLSEWDKIKENFVNMMKTYEDKFKKDMNIHKDDFPPIISMENIRIKKYLPNDKDEFKIHVDVLRALLAKRFLVYILYLTDVEEGGETYFPRQNIKVKPKEGRLVMFPPFWSLPHSGLKPIKGTKYVIMSYLHYGDILNNELLS